MTETREHALITRLRSISGRRHVRTTSSTTLRYRRGYRTGSGPALAVVQPGSLVELWRVASACVEADVSLIMQAANTGLTGGSTPCGDDYPGGVVIISTSRLRGLHLIEDNRQVVCLPGTTLHHLEKALRPLDREAHSVIGSSCLGASVIGGVCNSSGGALVQRGPAYTEMALYGQVTAAGRLELVNHLGIDLGDDPEQALGRLEAGRFAEAEIRPCTHARASAAADYAAQVRDIDAPTPARFNADPTFLHEASGSAGKVVVFAVRLDTFARDADTATFYIGTNDPGELSELRRTVLRDWKALPVLGEYIHATAFEIAARYGRDTMWAIERVGTDRLPLLFGAKSWLDAWATRLFGVGEAFSDRLLQHAGRLTAERVPQRLREFHARFEHHLILTCPAAGIEEARRFFSAEYPTARGAVFECTAQEASRALLLRFAVAGAAVRYRAVHQRDVADIVALDIALPRNTSDWAESLPPQLAEPCVARLYYGHFFCYVFHQDYVLARGADPDTFKQAVLDLVDRRGAEYPAEHNVGHIYSAKPELARFYRSLDPRNQLNPGIGKTPKARHWLKGNGRRHHAQRMAAGAAPASSD
jgi:D-lactate dehydrogenase